MVRLVALMMDSLQNFISRIPQTNQNPIQNNTTRNDTEIDCETYANCDESIQCPVECQLCMENDEQTHNITQQQADNSTANPVYMVYDKECYECTENDKCNPIICDDLKKLLNDSSYNHNKYDGHSLRRPMMLGVAIVAVAIGAGIGITYCIYKKWRARHHNPNNQQLMQQIAALQQQIAQLPEQLQQLLMQGQQQNNNQNGQVGLDQGVQAQPEVQDQQQQQDNDHNDQVEVDQGVQVQQIDNENIQNVPEIQNALQLLQNQQFDINNANIVILNLLDLCTRQQQKLHEINGL